MAMRSPLVYLDSQHKPMQSPDVVDPTFLPISARTGNRMQRLSDGLYMGSVPTQPVVYVGPLGTNAPTSGSKASPYLTLDYALAAVMPQVTAHTEITVALKSGGSYVLNNRYTMPNTTSRIRFTYWGDPTYGDFDSGFVGGGSVPAYVLQALIRPTILVAAKRDSLNMWQASGVSGNVILEGVRIDLPARPAPTPVEGDYGVVDFVESGTLESASLTLRGAVINITDNVSVFGLLGVKSRTRISLSQVATQFLVKDLKADGTAGLDAQNLAIRPNFIHFYQDYAGNDFRRIPLYPTAGNSSNASGLLNLDWSDTTSMPVAGAGNSVASFPTLSDFSYGMRNYFTGIRRDQQSRPTNVVSPRLF